MSDAAAEPVPVLVIAMGVSGSGKSTLAARLARAWDFRLLEADDFHPAANRERMARGEPLTDAMREPWIAALCAALRRHRAQGESCVLAWSGLRRGHRQRFRELGYPTRFIHLAGDPELVRARLRARTGHFAPADLLDSQLLALEAPAGEADVVAVDLAPGIDEVTRQANAALRHWLARPPRR
ncbi:gluconokinase, GntK/IdnK-type [Luteimonas sp. RD2P54]|uniref:Gluconokinase n=1 Tax=Luteimonas endophytica TaxID=3042023 RepID=A0ABT6JA06_9GAMM|nr:gluconokinase, GntK/IdnK-type [Luteimonas endophytica]MDH5823656.1 gluconokinase, GntK/IdnK-type [Luteimonas endophytica]